MYFLWHCPSFSLFAKWRLELLVPSQSDLFFYSLLFSRPFFSSEESLSLSLPTVASHSIHIYTVYKCKQSILVLKKKKNPQSTRPPPLHQHNPFGFLEKTDAGSVSQSLQIGTCTDRMHTWTWIFWSFCITQSTAWHDRHIELILIPCYVQEFDLAVLSVFKDIRYDCFMLSLPIMSGFGLCKV